MTEEVSPVVAAGAEEGEQAPPRERALEHDRVVVYGHDVPDAVEQDHALGDDLLDAVLRERRFGPVHREHGDGRRQGLRPLGGLFLGVVEIFFVFSASARTPSFAVSCWRGIDAGYERSRGGVLGASSIKY